MRIFVSYSSDERELVAPVVYSLRNEGHTVFFDQDDLPPAEDYNARIRAAIRQSNRFLFFISPSSVSHEKYALSELSFAKKKWKRPAGRVIPILLKDTPPNSIPPYLRSITYLRPSGSLPAETAALLASQRRATVLRTLYYSALFAVVLGLTSIVAVKVIDYVDKKIRQKEVIEKLSKKAEEFFQTRHTKRAVFQLATDQTLVIQGSQGSVYARIKQAVDEDTATYWWRYWDPWEKLEVEDSGLLFTESVKISGKEWKQVSSDDRMELGPYSVRWSKRDEDSAYISYPSDVLSVYSDPRPLEKLKLPRGD